MSAPLFENTQIQFEVHVEKDNIKSKRIFYDFKEAFKFAREGDHYCAGFYERLPNGAFISYETNPRIKFAGRVVCIPEGSSWDDVNVRSDPLLEESEPEIVEA
jgi:hypothetical protein